MTADDRKARLVAHRELEMLRAAARGGKKRLPPSARIKARKRAMERADKYDEVRRFKKGKNR